MDLLDVLDADKRRKAGEMLDALNVNVNAHSTDVEGFRKFTAGLQKDAGFAAPSKPVFDEAGFKELRDLMTAGRM
ncbi:hypothetical protein BSK46_14215 [Paenibacillus odorifer]|uniref:hypothetical protein n=1 Tax=Paenibacillus odorifer TaxID=189426 RepID=UPI00096F8C55|nr:hypothetical protein [Paenibacillus odorifer]OME37881.1 hypothetical protein BSK46_14215 [Paenibacillus odorifer]